MKRLDVEPTTDVLHASLQEDTIGRNPDMISFIRLLNETEGPYTYMIDAAWGEGKTFFLKSVVLVLKILNPALRTPMKREEIAALSESIGDMQSLYIPFYFNAWENDFTDDPISSLLASMAAAFQEEGSLRDKNSIEMVSAAADAILPFVAIGSSFAGLVKAMRGEELLPEHNRRRMIRSKLNDVANAALADSNTRMIVFIDELDRCRPNYAVRLLEQTKSLFQNERIILVFAADACQLANAVSGQYGTGFDSVRFLERFFDQRVLLSPIDGMAHAMDTSLHANTEHFDKLVKEYSNKNPLTIRDAYRLKHSIEGARAQCRRMKEKGTTAYVAYQLLLPLLVFISRDDPALFRSIVSGANSDPLYEYGLQFPTFNELMRRIAVEKHPTDREEASLSEGEHVTRSYFNDVYSLIFGSHDASSYYDLRNRLGYYGPDVFSPKVFKCLDFSE